jgi:hypothetical protein
MNIETKNEIKSQMAKYNANDFQLYCDEAGWQGWMQAYTNTPESDTCSETELRDIKCKQFELFCEVHPTLAMNKVLFQ